jgi:hypothetical protein
VKFLLLVCAPAVCFAGAICGTVRDSETLQPVHRAAVFLFDNLDQYTGRYAGTDVAGHYCIDNVPNGTYTLQVRVDDISPRCATSSWTRHQRRRTPALCFSTSLAESATSDVVFELTPRMGRRRVRGLDVRGRLVMGRGAGPSGGTFAGTRAAERRSGRVRHLWFLARPTEAVRRFVRLR